MQLAVQNLSHFPKTSRGPVGFFSLHLMFPPIYRILTYIKYTHAAWIASKSWKSFQSLLLWKDSPEAAACSRCQLQRWFVAFPFLWAVPAWKRERARGSEESSNSISPDTNMAPASADNFRWKCGEEVTSKVQRSIFEWRFHPSF